MHPLLRPRLSRNLNMALIANIYIIILLTQISWADFWFQRLPENKEQYKKCMQFHTLYRVVCLDESWFQRWAGQQVATLPWEGKDALWGAWQHVQRLQRPGGCTRSPFRLHKVLFFFIVKDNNNNKWALQGLWRRQHLHLHTDLSFHQIYSNKEPNITLFCLESLVFSSLRQALEIPLLQLTQLLCKQNFW